MTQTCFATHILRSPLLFGKVRVEDRGLCSTLQAEHPVVPLGRSEAGQGLQDWVRDRRHGGEVVYTFWTSSRSSNTVHMVRKLATDEWDVTY